MYLLPPEHAAEVCAQLEGVRHFRQGLQQTSPTQRIWCSKKMVWLHMLDVISLSGLVNA